MRDQGARCMDCGIPFCHQGCPLGNVIPDWNDLVYRQRWQAASDRLHATNNFPEWTGRLCPAPCEGACVLGINDDPVTIKSIELSIVEHAFENGWIQARPPVVRTGKRVAVVGSGPAGLAAADELNKVGHQVTVFERADRIGGLLRYGIPEFKLEKRYIDRRLALMAAEGVEFRTGVEIGIDLPVASLRRQFDAIVLCCGTPWARDLQIPGRELGGVHFAVEYLTQQNRRLAGDHDRACRHHLGRRQARRHHRRRRHRRRLPGDGPSPGGGLGPPVRAARAAAGRPARGQSLAAVAERLPHLVGARGRRRAGLCRVDRTVSRRRARAGSGRCRPSPSRPGSTAAGCRSRRSPAREFELEADLVLLAMGFLGPERGSLLSQLGVKLTERGNVWRDDAWMTTEPGVFTAGDMQRGQSLIVWAIADGRNAAQSVDNFLMGKTA